jgi:hypothetical protein
MNKATKAPHRDEDLRFMFDAAWDNASSTSRPYAFFVRPYIASGVGAAFFFARGMFVFLHACLMTSVFTAVLR